MGLLVQRFLNQITLTPETVQLPSAERNPRDSQHDVHNEKVTPHVRLAVIKGAAAVHEPCWLNCSL
jgi:hypothetical protein